MIVQLIRLLFLGVRVATKYAQHNQDGPPDKLDNALHTRRPASITQYIDIATKAMINDGKKLDDVKIILLNRGLHEDHFDAVINRAQQNYKTWFNDNDSKPILTAFAIDQQFMQIPAAPRASIKISTHKGEDHALHFCSITDYRRYYEPSGRAILQAFVDRALLTDHATMANGEIEITQTTFARVGGNAVNPYLRVVSVNKQKEAVYPFIYTDIKTFFYTHQIVEWTNGEPIIEAEVVGEINNTYPVSFFATDYAVNKQIYQSQPIIEVRLAAVLLELFEAEKNNGEISQQPKGFWANKNYDSESYFSFEAVLLDIKEAPIDRMSTGFMMTLKLAPGDRPGETLVIDAYIIYNNIKDPTIQKGMLVKGILWFQGEIVPE